MAAEVKEHRVNAMTQRIENESRQLPYRWGYFQGVFLIPWSLLIIGGTWMELRRPEHEPLYLSIIALLLGLIGLPLAIGLLRKRKFALPLVYLSFGLSLVRSLPSYRSQLVIFATRATGEVLFLRRNSCSSGFVVWSTIVSARASSLSDSAGR